jgi:hypothetical protein
MLKTKVNKQATLMLNHNRISLHHQLNFQQLLQVKKSWTEWSTENHLKNW